MTYSTVTLLFRILQNKLAPNFKFSLYKQQTEQLLETTQLNSRAKLLVTPEKQDKQPHTKESLSKIQPLKTKGLNFFKKETEPRVNACYNYGKHHPANYQGERKPCKMRQKTVTKAVSLAKMGLRFSSKMQIQASMNCTV